MEENQIYDEEHSTNENKNKKMEVGQKLLGS